MLLTRRPTPQRPSTSSCSSVTVAYPERDLRTAQHDFGMAAFVSKAEHDFRQFLDTLSLQRVSSKLQAEFKEKLGNSDNCMLPSYKDALPTGMETGEFLAADLGGSSFKLALVRLVGSQGGDREGSTVVQRWDFVVDEAARALAGTSFFDWMAGKIASVAVEMRRMSLHGDIERSPTLSLGLSWSFPLDHKSRSEARLLKMGKAFNAADGLIGQDLGSLIKDSCRKCGVAVNVAAIVNDGAASLLSQMYICQTTSMALVLGTGLNAAINLQIPTLNNKAVPSEFTLSPRSAGLNTLINTELSMFGKGAYELTEWDHILNLMHPNPDFQPLEHLTSGRYIGEVVRLILLKAIQTPSIALFGGELPHRFGPYELQTRTLATLESDVSYGQAQLEGLHPLPSGAPYTRQDTLAVRRIAAAVTDRATAYLATAIHALWKMERAFGDAAGSGLSSPPAVELGSKITCVGCLGSVLTKYPGFRRRTQLWLDRLMASEERGERIELVVSDEGDGALVGAAVAIAVGMSSEDRMSNGIV